MDATIQRVPPEIWHYILAGEQGGPNLLPARDLQRTTLSLLQALPAASVDQRLLYRHLVVARAGQLWPLYRHLAEFHATDDSDERPPSRSFELRSWTGDADMLVNILGQLPELSSVALNIGTNFAPEHLEDVFLRPRPALRQIVLTFRPYVDKASYHQFLAGAYQDMALQALARWPAAETPESALRHISIVQEVAPRHLVDSSAPQPVLDPNAEPRRKEEERVKGRGRYTGHGPFPYLDERLASAQPKIFAQPIVFFNMGCITELASSPVAAHVSHLRLSIPLRDVVTALVASPHSFPSLRFLDLSTTNLRLHTHVPTLLAHYPNLEHLVLDHTNLFGFLGFESDKGAECARELGKLIAMGGMGRSKEREREIARWEEAAWRGRTARRLEAARHDGGTSSGQEAAQADPADEAADELAQLTTQEYNPAARRRNVRSMAHSTFSIRLTTTGHGGPGATPHQASQPLTPYHPESIAFVLPSPPALRSFCLGGEAPLTPAQRHAWQRAFDAGWRDGVAKLVEWSVKGVGERFERARRKAEADRKEWDKWLARHSVASTNGTTALQEDSQPSPPTASSHKGKGKAKASSSSSQAASSTSKPLPPPRIILYRFPSPSEALAARDSHAPASDLIEVAPSSDWRSRYTGLLDADVPCKLCLVPNVAEGPLRRGGNGEVAEHDEDDDSEGEGGGDGGTSSAHGSGCGHRVGTQVWEE